MIRGLGIALAVLLVVSGAKPPEQKQSALVFPRIAEAGGIVVLPQAPYQPGNGTKVIFDITAGGKAEELNKGLDRVARFVNLHAGHGAPADGLHVVLVLHGNAVDSALTNDAYKQRTGTETNPNLPLLRRLGECGVKMYVCGQSLAQKGYRHDEIAEPLTVAVSAMLVNVQSQADAYAVLSVN